MRTYTGRSIDLSDPRSDVIDIVDIAHHLSIIPRYFGATREPYPVAQHCVVGSKHCLWSGEFLLHDAAEAYLGDVIRGLKRYLDDHGGGAYSKLEGRWQDAIYERFGVDSSDGSRREVKIVDDRICGNEIRDLCSWSVDDKYVPLRDCRLRVWSAAIAEREYLARFEALVRAGELRA
jgi:hypothetical protein